MATRSLDADSGVRRAEIVGVLTAATEMGVGAPPGALFRGTCLSVAFARHLGWSEEDVGTVYWYSLVRYSGCHAENHNFSALLGDEIAFNRGYGVIDTGDPAELLPLVIGLVQRAHAELGAAGIEALLAANLPGLPQAANAIINGHCDIAQRLATRLGLDAAIVSALGQFRERLDGKGVPNQISGDALLPPVRLVFLCHDIAVLDAMAGRAAAMGAVRKRNGAAYEPALADAFLAAGDILLPVLDSSSPWAAAMAAEPGTPVMLSAAELEEACLVIADFCDLQLPDAVSHSRAVAELAGGAALALGMPPGDCRSLRLAGLMHDLGYAAVAVRARGGYRHTMHAEGDTRLHPFYGEDMIARVGALRDVATLVGTHHEATDGSGYFRGTNAAGLSLGARVLAAAEAYQTAREGRFGEAGRPADAAAAEIRAQVAAGRLDADAAKAVLAAAGHRVTVKKTERVAGLTNRELDVLKLVAVGLSTQEAGDRLGLSPKTVDNHLQNLYPKIGARTRAGATLFAIAHGICNPPN